MPNKWVVRVFACAAAVACNARFDVGADDFVLAIVKASTTKHTGELIAKVADSVGLRHKLEDLFYRQKRMFILLRVPQAVRSKYESIQTEGATIFDASCSNILYRVVVET